MKHRLKIIIIASVILCGFLTADLWGPRVSKQISKWVEPIARWKNEAAIPDGLQSVTFPTVQPENSKITTGSFELARKPIGRIAPAIGSSTKTQRRGSSYRAKHDSLLWVNLDTRETSSVVLDEKIRLIEVVESSVLVLTDKSIKVFDAGKLSPIYTYNHDYKEVAKMISLPKNQVRFDKGEKGSTVFDWSSGETVAEFSRNKEDLMDENPTGPSSIDDERYFINNDTKYGEKGVTKLTDTVSGKSQDLVSWDFIKNGCAVRSSLFDAETNSVYVSYINGWFSRFDVRESPMNQPAEKNEE